MDSDSWRSSLAALMSWLLPEQLPIAARITVFSLALAGGVYLSVWHGRRVLAPTRESRVSDAMLPIVLGLFFIAYLAFMVLATSLEANLSLNTRYAFPIYVTTMIMMTIILAHTAGVGGHVDRKSVVKGQSVSVRVVLVGRRILKKKKQNNYKNKQ